MRLLTYDAFINENVKDTSHFAFNITVNGFTISMTLKV